MRLGHDGTTQLANTKYGLSPIKLCRTEVLLKRLLLTRRIMQITPSSPRASTLISRARPLQRQLRLGDIRQQQRAAAAEEAGFSRGCGWGAIGADGQDFRFCVLKLK